MHPGPDPIAVGRKVTAAPKQSVSEALRAFCDAPSTLHFERASAMTTDTIPTTSLHRIIRRTKLEEFTGLRATAIQKLMLDPNSGVPKPIPLAMQGGRAIGFLASEIAEYQRKLIAIRDSGREKEVRCQAETPNARRKREREAGVAAAAAASGPSPVPAVAPPLSKRAAAAGRKAAVAARRSAKKSTRV
jgi:predicted DNA-binding transcriptional regulator AlpA